MLTPNLSRVHLRISLALALAALLVVCLMPSEGGAQADEGSWQPRLTVYPGDFYSIAYASAETLWAAGPGGIILSQDGGASWRWTLNTSLRAVDSADDGLHGWAVGPGDAIYATSDGGKTWSQQRSSSDLDFFAVGALDAEHAVAVGHRRANPPVIYDATVSIYTADGGRTWAVSPTPYDVQALAVLKETSNAWAATNGCSARVPGCANEHKLLASDDAGKTWRQVSSAEPDSAIFDLQFTSASTGWAVTSGGVLRTSSGGKSWKAVREIPETTYVASLSALDDDSAVILLADTNGASQRISKTTDGGKTWNDVAGASQVQSMRYHDQMHAVRATLHQSLEMSNDGGITWQEAAMPVFATRFRLAFDFVDPLNGWAAATKLLRTRDAGQSWEVATDREFDSIDFVSPAEGWATQTVCALGPCQSIVSHSIDGGETWTEQFRHEGSDIPRLTFVHRLNGWVSVGADKPLLHTRDGGLTWTEQHPPSSYVVFASATTLWASDGFVLYLSTDGGDTWSPAISLASADGCYPSNFAASDAKHVWLVANTCSGAPRDTSFLQRTVDGGVHWERVLPRAIGVFNVLTFFNSSDGVVVRAVCSETEVNKPCELAVMTTRDGGVSWNSNPTSFAAMYFDDYKFTDLWHGWLSETVGGGESELVKQTLYGYSTTPPPLVMPDTGRGHDEDSRSIVVAFCILGALLVGAGSVSRRRRRRPC